MIAKLLSGTLNHKTNEPIQIQINFKSVLALHVHTFRKREGEAKLAVHWPAMFANIKV